MKIYTISYQKHWNNEGTCYTQLIKIDKELAKKYNNRIKYLKNKVNKKIKTIHIYSEYDGKILSFTKPLKDGINYMKLTGLYEFYKMLSKNGIDDKRILDRNTIIQVL